jgi:hypothetical protein
LSWHGSWFIEVMFLVATFGTAPIMLSFVQLRRIYLWKLLSLLLVLTDVECLPPKVLLVEVVWFRFICNSWVYVRVLVLILNLHILIPKLLLFLRVIEVVRCDCELLLPVVLLWVCDISWASLFRCWHCRFLCWWVLTYCQWTLLIQTVYEFSSILCLLRLILIHF